ncbi:flagellar hook-length control protein FliK [Aquibacillus sp. 3ASR75-11]|uniref:Flagellar hook-length control protein FliK n=1 Tax=Terrihalobacillus insolitus TaxID=2950438 RepID=A0A9X3WPT0_9BACI|nr:flagellar hook-length control protein FliK [Terrihalobacillus insolitus]MDC3414134.1 flagellar hook-length control protein FliK [Terrihalobacillus insolitus]MDC3423575.1 flagellar hook-length control protein FliK [Terrihalobacillus insolitus]
MKAAGMVIKQAPSLVDFTKKSNVQTPSTNRFVTLLNQAKESSNTTDATVTDGNQLVSTIIEQIKQLLDPTKSSSNRLSIEGTTVEISTQTLLSKFSKAQLKELRALLADVDGETGNTGLMSDALVKELQSALRKLGEQGMTLEQSLEEWMPMESAEKTNVQPDLINDGMLLSALWDKAINVLKSIEDQAPTKKQAAVLKNLLEQWVAVTKQTSKNDNASQVLTNKGTQKEQAIWTQLIQTYQNRSTLVGQQRYANNAEVTSADVSKWVSNALARYKADESVQIKESNLTPTQQPMTKLEQYVIYVNQTANQETKEQQVMQELQRVLKTSKFLQKNGMEQLAIKLKPVNMGDMVVKLTQLNGEMVVKISVTTQVAKDMLEGNLQQLRHMFSPQQVVIEKTDPLSLGDLYSLEQEERFKDAAKDEQQQQSQQQNQGNTPSELSFHDILVNEKV